MRRNIASDLLWLVRNEVSRRRFSSSPWISLQKPQYPGLLHPQKAIPIPGSGAWSRIRDTRFVYSVAESEKTGFLEKNQDEQSSIDVHNILSIHRESSIDEIDEVLSKCGIVLTEGLILAVLHRNRYDWKPAFTLFQLLPKGGFSSSAIYNEILEILGKLKRFEEFRQVLDEMSERKGLADEKTYAVLLNRYTAAHKVEEAIGVYERRREFGIKDDFVAFQGILTLLCRCKHVDAAEALFCSKKNEFGFDIKTMNIILNGWCVLGNVNEATRFCNDIVESNCEPDLYTYATFIHVQTKKGKLDTAMKLFREMWKSDIKPNVVICNTIVDALCSEKRMLEAFEVVKEMSEKGCVPDVSTYNSFVKRLCKVRKMEKVYQLLDEMEGKGILADDITYGYLLKSSNNPTEIEAVLERMKKNGCKMTSDLYNVILKLYVFWGFKAGVGDIWAKLEKTGLGPDQKSYTIMVHGLYEKKRFGDALRYYFEMALKGLVPEPRTEFLVYDMKMRLRDQADTTKRGIWVNLTESKSKETKKKKTDKLSNSLENSCPNKAFDYVVKTRKNL